MPTSTRAASEAASSRPPKRARRSERTALPPHPAGVRPSLNALLAPRASAAQRHASLGQLAALPDELLLHLLSLLPDADAARMCAVSRLAHAFAALEGSWRERCLARHAGRIGSWHGSWRHTYAQLARRDSESSASSSLPPPLPRADGLCSDLLYAPWRLSHVSIDVDVPSTLPRLACDAPHAEFEAQFAGRLPVILSAADFPARGWDLQRLCAEAGQTDIQAEAMRCSPATYLAYATSMRPPYAPGVVPDESPLYLFDAQLPQRLGEDWAVPKLLDRKEKGKEREWDHDLFGLLGERRPDYRWVIAGPERSGSGVSGGYWHKDPNATSAWNTILSGAKHWFFLPPHVVPPGVFVSPDEAEVTAPLSLAEWAESGFLAETRRRHGPRSQGGDGALMEGRCGPGETVYVPTGWWHCVLNTEECTAYTQNLVSRHELGAVLDFMKSRPSHVSGFKRAPAASASDPSAASAAAPATASAPADACEDEDESAPAELYDLFCSRLRAYDAALLDAALTQVEQLEQARRGRTTRIENQGSGWWRRMKALERDGTPKDVKSGEEGEGEKRETDAGFAALLGEEELEEVPW